MITDKELLKLAAKAAGIELGEYWTPYLEEIHNQHWNPLRNDGQALRLAVQMGMVVDFRHGYTWATYTDNPDSADGAYMGNSIKHNDDPYAATRRAIVRAAAMIGESM